MRFFSLLIIAAINFALKAIGTPKAMKAVEEFREKETINGGFNSETQNSLPMISPKTAL